MGSLGKRPESLEIPGRVGSCPLRGEARELWSHRAWPGRQSMGLERNVQLKAQNGITPFMVIHRRDMSFRNDAMSF